MRRLGLLFLLATIPQSKIAPPTTALDYFRRADDLTNIRLPGSAAFHMRVTFHAYPGIDFAAPGKSDILSGDGTYDADIKGQMFSGDHLVPAETPKDLGLSFAVPIFFFQGSGDLTTPAVLAQLCFDEIRAPRKEFVSLQGGHFSVFINSGELLEELVARVLPLAREN